MEKAIKAQIEAFAIMAEIEGMKAKNAERESGGFAQAYDARCFAEASEQLAKIAKSL